MVPAGWALRKKVANANEAPEAKHPPWQTLCFNKMTHVYGSSLMLTERRHASISNGFSCCHARSRSCKWAVKKCNHNKKRWKVRGSCVHVRLEIIVLFLFWQTAAVQSCLNHFSALFKIHKQSALIHQLISHISVTVFAAWRLIIRCSFINYYFGSQTICSCAHWPSPLSPWTLPS